LREQLKAAVPSFDYTRHGCNHCKTRQKIEEERCRKEAERKEAERKEAERKEAERKRKETEEKQRLERAFPNLSKFNFSQPFKEVWHQYSFLSKEPVTREFRYSGT
jgi:hypothetical protein